MHRERKKQDALQARNEIQSHGLPSAGTVLRELFQGARRPLTNLTMQRSGTAFNKLRLTKICFLSLPLNPIQLCKGTVPE
jgi:hypothetical protein